MKRLLLIASVFSVAVATALWAGTAGVVTTVDGEKHEGEIIEAANQVIIRAHGVDTVIERDQVTDIDYTSYAERFEQSLATLAPEDVDGRVKLARDAFERHEYALAQKATQSALDFDPLNRSARQLDSLISSQIILEGQKGAAATQTAAPDPTDTLVPKPARPTTRRIRGLSDEQINRVRQVELTQDDKVRIQFRDNVRKRYVDSLPGGNFRAFASRTDVDQALTIVNNGTPEMADDVIIRNDPRGIMSFGRRIQTAIVQGCATANCHGNNGVGDFRLLAGNLDNRAMVTNFYLLNEYSKQVDPGEATGIFTPSAVKMVDRGKPKDSLLYQYALPRARAAHKHPQVRDWDGLFRNDDDRFAKELVGWMDDDLVRLPPAYGFTYELVAKKSDASTQPTSEPTTNPTTNPAE